MKVPFKHTYGNSRKVCNDKVGKTVISLSSFCRTPTFSFVDALGLLVQPQGFYQKNVRPHIKMGIECLLREGDG